MSVEILCDRPSKTASRLREQLELHPGIGTINWTGARVPPEEAEVLPHPILNFHSRTDKLAQLVRLEMQGVTVPEYSISGPGREGLWWGRTLNHQQGRDFTTPPADPGFWVRQLDLPEEWRLHIFRTKKGNIKLVRSGIKVPRRPRHHPWVRSHRLGWKISYTGGAPEEAVAQAKKAVEALDLDFGAVDVGVLNHRPWAVVLEVNTCPGLDTGNLLRYVDEIKRRLS